MSVPQIYYQESFKPDGKDAVLVKLHETSFPFSIGCAQNKRDAKAVAIKNLRRAIKAVKAIP